MGRGRGDDDRGAPKQLDAHEADPPLFADGKAEQTLVWEEAGGDVAVPASDWLRDDRAAIDDFKTSGSANPESFSRSVFGYGYDLQADMYCRGLHLTAGAAYDLSFGCRRVRKSRPMRCRSCRSGPHVMTLARKKVDCAIEMWRRCLAPGDWPGYPRQVAYAELPAPWKRLALLVGERRNGRNDRIGDNVRVPLQTGSPTRTSRCSSVSPEEPAPGRR